MPEVVVPIPSVSYVVLHTYVEQPRQPNDDVVIHAMCAELWAGSQLIALTQPQHTFGLPPRLVEGLCPAALGGALPTIWQREAIGL